MEKTHQSRLRRALRFAWWFGAAMLMFQMVEHTALDSRGDPYLVDPPAAVHAMAVFVVAGTLGGFLVGWFWNWKSSAGGSGALGVLAFCAFSGGFSVLFRDPSEHLSVENLIVSTVVMGAFGWVMGWLVYHEKKSGLITNLLNMLDSWW